MRTNRFTADGRRYVLSELHRIDSADAELWNDNMVLQIDHRGRVSRAGFLEPNLTAYSGDLRCFYVRDDDTGRFWSVPHDPVMARPDAFEFSPGLSDIQWRVVCQGIRVDLRVAIPRDADVELWTATVTNVSRKPRRISLYSFLPVGLHAEYTQRSGYDRGLQGALCNYFPYYAHYQDYFTLKERRFGMVCASDATPASWELCVEDFVGRRGLHDPDGLRTPRLSSPDNPNEIANVEHAFVFQFRRRLAPGKSSAVNVLFGPCKDRAEAMRLKRRYLAKNQVVKALAKTEAFLQHHAPSVRVETPDREFDHFVNLWLPRWCLELTRTMCHNSAPQARNAIQDVMGGVYVDPARVRDSYARIWSHQHTTGWLPHALSFSEGAEGHPISKIPHRDTNVWGAMSVHYYVAETGDHAALDQEIPFGNSAKRTATLYDHICMGLEWLLRDRTRRGLSRIGEGDWNDPLNMVGPAGRGESVWLTEALALALDTWATVAAARGDARRASRYRREATRCRRAINRHGWDGQWYARGFTDAGKPFGVRAEREGKIFLNAQSWAMMSSTADGKRTASCIRAVERMLMSPSGPMVLAPPFERMRTHIGRLTQKVPGTTEHGSVYSHAAAFYAVGLYCARESDRAFRVLRMLLPGYDTHTLERAGQLPLYIPNCYRGTPAGRRAGESSHVMRSGAAAVFYRTAVTMLLGVRAELDGLVFDPQLPAHWPRARVWRRWRGAEFDVLIRRSRKATRTQIEFDGRTLPDNRVPPQPRGSKHTVEVTVPARLPSSSQQSSLPGARP